MDPFLITKALSAGKALTKAAQAVNRSNGIQERIDHAAAQVEREVGQVAYAVAKAIVAHAIGATPSSEQVDSFLASAAGDPTFPSRAYRLLGEARKTATRQNRVLLAAALYGLPCSSISDADRERVDRLIETLLPSDVALLSAIHRLESQITPAVTSWMNGVYAVRMEDHFRVVSAQQLREKEFSPDLFSLPNLPSDRLAFMQLESVGLIELASGNRRGAVPVSPQLRDVHEVITTQLGMLLLTALQDIDAAVRGADANVP